MTKKANANPLLSESESESSGWTRTTVVLREECLQKLKILCWWEKKTLKDLFDEMIQTHLASQHHLDRLFEEREKNIQEKKTKD